MLLKVTFLPVSCIILYLSFDGYPVSILRLENILCSLDLYLVQFFCLPTIIFFFCIFPLSIGSKGLKLIKWHLIFLLLFLKTVSNLFLFCFLIWGHLHALKVYIRGKQPVILVLFVAHKQLKCSSCSCISVWLTARLLRWNCWLNQNAWLQEEVG